METPELQENKTLLWIVNIIYCSLVGQIKLYNRLHMATPEIDVVPSCYRLFLGGWSNSAIYFAVRSLVGD